MDRPTRSSFAHVTAILAREARKAVVFRRGPSRQVLLLSWNLTNDVLIAGQWLKRRVYERRCDLSPDGELLVYFTGYGGPHRTWTAVSRPPYFTALAIWPKGDAWGGGGLFDGPRSLRLNHRPDFGDMELAEGFSLPPGFRLSPLEDWSGRGEDDPIYTMRMARDGWSLVQESSGGAYHEPRAKIWHSFEQPLVVEKPLAGGGKLSVSLHGIHERNGRWYVQTGQVLDGSGETPHDLGRIDWADVDHNGDVLFSRDGCLWRLSMPTDRSGPAREPILVANLNAFEFEPVEAPASAQAW